MVCVTPDYLAIGSDDDYFLVPMRLETALAIARRFGFVLPTPKIVDAVYAQSQVQLRPQPLPASDAMAARIRTLPHVTSRSHSGSSSSMLNPQHHRAFANYPR